MLPPYVEMVGVGVVMVGAYILMGMVVRVGTVVLGVMV